MRTIRRPVCATLLIIAILNQGCMATSYQPQALSQDELYLQFRGYQGLEIRTRTRRIAREATSFVGLPHHVRCVPKARQHANAAVRLGVTRHFFTAFAVGSALAGIIHPAITFSQPLVKDQDVSLDRLFVLYGSGSLIVLWMRDFFIRPHALGHAVDAVNHYNDARGSIDESCDVQRPGPPSPVSDDPPPQEKNMGADASS